MVYGMYSLRAFKDDWATHEYYKTSGSTLEVPLDENFSDQCKKAITMYIVRMLQIDSTLRPSAKDLLDEFSRNFHLLSSDDGGMDLSIEPAAEVQMEDHTSDDDRSIRMLQDAIEKEPLNYWLWHNLCRLYAATNNLDGAIHACELGIKKSGANLSPLMELTNFYVAKSDYKSCYDDRNASSQGQTSRFTLGVEGLQRFLNYTNFSQQ